jgi:hypothetical protein
MISAAEILRVRVCCFLAILFFNSCILTAQTNVYHPFPNSNAVWNVSLRYYIFGSTVCKPDDTNVEDNYSYFLKGDTLINSIVYHKMYLSGQRHVYCSGSSKNMEWWEPINQYAGSMRQDLQARKVFFIDPGSHFEDTLYDFSVGIGGKVYHKPCGSIVTGIDSVRINGSYRKLFITGGRPVIEGLGSIMGLQECDWIEGSARLSCFSINGKTLYPDSGTSCQRITSARKVDATIQKFQIYPNPAADRSTVISDRLLRNATVSIMNSIGQIIQSEENISGISFSLQHGDLAAGLYFVRIRDGDFTGISRLQISR